VECNAHQPSVKNEAIGELEEIIENNGGGEPVW